MPEFDKYFRVAPALEQPLIPTPSFRLSYSSAEILKFPNPHEKREAAK